MTCTYHWDAHGKLLAIVCGGRPGPSVHLRPPSPSRADCPDCGKNICVNNDGSIRKHKCGPTGPGSETTT